MCNSFCRRFLSPFFIAVFSDCKQQSNSVGFKTFVDNRCRPSLLFPNTENVWDTATRTFTYVYEIEHLDKCTVTRVRNSATLCSFDIYAESAGVGKCDNILLFDDNKALSTVIVDIYQTVGKSFSECIMNGSIVNAVATFESEWNFDSQVYYTKGYFLGI